MSSGAVFADGPCVRASANNNHRDESREVYIVLSGKSDADIQLESAGYDVLHTLADESILIIEGPPRAQENLQSITVVEDIFQNQSSVIESIANPTLDSRSIDERLPNQQWDKLITNTFKSHTVTTGRGTTVAIIDTGVDHCHPNIRTQIDIDQGRMFRNGHIYAGSDTVDFPGSEVIERPVATDVTGHGTHVAGIAAASSDLNSVVGVAPNASIVPLRVFFFEKKRMLGKTTYKLTRTLADILIAIDYSVKIGVDVINLSLGIITSPDSRAFSAYRRVIQYAIKNGTIITTAAGNNGIDLDDHSDRFLPGEIPGTINVAATGPNEKRSSYSNYGNSAIDIAAPGGGYQTEVKSRIQDADSIKFPYPTNEIFSTLPTCIASEQYGYRKGTSMAAAHVAGISCLLRELDPTLHPRHIKQIIEQGAIKPRGEFTSGLGAGRVDVWNSIKIIKDG